MLQRLIILCISLSQFCFSQDLSERSFYDIEKPENSGESIVIATDRHFYCTDERIYFTASYKYDPNPDEAQLSKVLYVELISWNGERIAQTKCKITANRSSGYLTIPGSLLSGNYYVRAYTKWMRNFPVENYSYGRVKIINPFKNEIDHGSVQEPGNEIGSLILTKGSSINGIECSTDKYSYTQREKVDLTIRLNSGELDHSNFCISVAKATDIDKGKYTIQNTGNYLAEKDGLHFLPEFRGVSISGKIISTNDSSSMANTIMHLSTPQKWNYFTTFRVNDNGLFYFTLPDIHGQQDFYIDAVTGNGGNAEILIDNDYCMREIQLPYIPFSLNENEQKIAQEMMVNMQLSNIYREETNATTGSNRLPFYGSPNHVYYTEDYVQLPNLEEFIFELVNEIRTVKIRKKSYLKLLRYSQYRDMEPLVLVDNVPVSDIDELLAVPLERLEKLEIFDEPYIVAGIEYSGIIGFSTKRKDFAGIELNKNSLFFNYDMISEDNIDFTDYSLPTTNRDLHRRNLLFWDTDIELDPKQVQTISFYTSDSKGEYIVFIRSLNTPGAPEIYGFCNIEVE